MAKYNLTNQYQEITELEGSLPNNSVLYPILIAASKTPPDINTPYKAISSGDTQNFKALDGEKIYLRLFTNDDNAQFEVSVVTFIPEQIQNLSKKLPSGTIIAVDFIKGVTAQDYEGNLIEPNGIETTLGHDNGVFYNADGSFQGQRDRVKGVWAGKHTENLFKAVGNPRKGPIGCTILEYAQKKINVLFDKGTSGNQYVRPSSIESQSLKVGDSLTFSADVKLITNNNIRINIATDSPWATVGRLQLNKDDVGKRISLTYLADIENDKFAFEINGDGSPLDAQIILENVQFEKSSTPTPFCEKNRGDYQMGFKGDINLKGDTGYFIKEFIGKYKLDAWMENNFTEIGTRNESTTQLDSLRLNPSSIQTVVDLMNDDENMLIVNFSNGNIIDATLNGSDVTNKFYIVSNGWTNTEGVIYFWKNGEITNQYQGSPNVFLKKIILGKGRNLTVEEIDLYTNSDIDITDVGEFYPVAYSKKRTDQYGTYKRGWKIISTDEDIFEIRDKRYKVTDKLGVETIVYVDENGIKTGVSLDQVNGYLRVNASVVLPCDVEVL